MDNIATVADYLARFGAELATRVQQDAQPLHDPDIGERSPALAHLLRPLFPPQADVVVGIVSVLEQHRAALVIGEMGVGKSAIGAAIPFVACEGQPFRCLVMAPGHLVQKWQREVKAVIPNARAMIVRRLGDLLTLSTNKPTSSEFVICSRDRLKLSYAWKPAFNRHRFRGGCFCSSCGSIITNRDDVPVAEAELEQRKHHCLSCLSPLWQADGKGYRRFSLAQYIKDQLPRGYFDFLIADECHEYKASDSAQGNVLGQLASVCSKTIALTGTLSGGYADDLFYLLYRLNGRRLKAEGIGYAEVAKWMRRYGVQERITKHYEDAGDDNRYSKGRKGKTITRRKPGLSPLIFSQHLLGQAAFLHLDDLHDNLPSLDEEVVPLKMDAELEQAYRELETKIAAQMKSELARGSRALLGVYLNALLSYCDKPYGNEPISHPKHCNQLVAVPRDLSAQPIRGKQRRLLDLVAAEKDQRRKVWVFCQFTAAKDITARLHDLLTDAGIRTAVLKSTIQPEAREQWVKNRVDEGVECVISNPKLVETGLDLLDFPTLVFFQTGYSVFTARQASRRSWRIGQTKPVKVLYLYYEQTLQEKVLQLMGSKTQASLGVEGKFTDQGLVSMTSGEDLSLLLARSLVEGMRDVVDVQAAWRKVRTAASPARPQRHQVAIDQILADISH